MLSELASNYTYGVRSLKGDRAFFVENIFEEYFRVRVKRKFQQEIWLGWCSWVERSLVDRRDSTFTIEFRCF